MHSLKIIGRRYMSPVLKHGMKHLGNQTGKISFIYQGLFNFFSKAGVIKLRFIFCLAWQNMILRYSISHSFAVQAGVGRELIGGKMWNKEKKKLLIVIYHIKKFLSVHIYVYTSSSSMVIFFVFVLYNLLFYEIRLRARWTFASQALWCGHHPMDGHNHITQ